MNGISIEDLPNEGGRVVDRARAGERTVVTRDGRVGAELGPVPREPLEAKILLERWRALPTVDGDSLGRDLDELLDPSP